MLEPGPEFQPEQRRGCGAVALIVIGLLVLIPSGLCTSYMTIQTIVTSMSNKTPIPTDVIGFVVSIGGPFIVVGTLLTVLGISAKRR